MPTEEEMVQFIERQIQKRRKEKQEAEEQKRKDVTGNDNHLSGI